MAEAVGSSLVLVLGTGTLAVATPLAKAEAVDCGFLVASLVNGLFKLTVVVLRNFIEVLDLQGFLGFVPSMTLKLLDYPMVAYSLEVHLKAVQ